MNLSELFIRRPIMTLLLNISITVFGIQGFRGSMKNAVVCLFNSEPLRMAPKDCWLSSIDTWRGGAHAR